MFFQDCLLTAAATLLDLDLPPELLPLTITNQAAFLAGLDSECGGDLDWH
nr:hypothetical protein [uncultured Roseateles sp.]